ncbi:Sel1 repeat-containing protein [Novosphingobium sp. CF614]|uniref:SPOR domain-containing protein n=1 Tax=Novosphingobium sp. CF614 TaxID=1884364 RepID=UPI0008EEA377|nr:SPOR domain-containing protein [Novosphingobium sp. CF614]SFF98838.1 Sel1 repeat-containing protein [Novosphingobium sp. CF614]
MIDVRKFLALLCSGTLATASCLLPATSAWADVKAGVDAWSAGNYDAAVKEWQAPADRGDADAQFNLAQAYKFGRGVPLDLAKAEDLYCKAAARGHVQAADTCGLLLFQRGEREKAMPYIQASSARGDPRAQYILGVAYFNGDLVAKDWVRAYALVSLARQSGLPQAANALAQMDQHIPLADRQKSVILSTQIAAETDAARARLAASTELGSPPPRTAAAPYPAPEIASAENAVASAIRTAGSDSPATAGADYTLSPPPPMASRPTPPPPSSRPSPAPAPAPPKVAAKPKPAPPVAKPAAAKPASGPWRVQLGAFGVAGNADALWSKVRGRPELAGHGKLLVPAGKLTKLQAGGFASKADADAACSRLSASGVTCLAVRD